MSHDRVNVCRTVTSSSAPQPDRTPRRAWTEALDSTSSDPDHAEPNRIVTP